MTYQETLDRLRAALTSGMPFIGSIVRKSKIILHKGESLPVSPPTIAGVDINSVIHLSEGFFKRSIGDMGGILAHEALHAALRHPARIGEREETIWHIASDIITNHLLSEFIPLPSDALTACSLGLPSEWEKLSVEELYEKLLEKTIKVNVEIDLIPYPLGGGETLQEGDSSLYEGNEQEKERKWKEAIAQAAMAAKQAGRLPVGAERFVEELLKPKLPVRSLLRQFIRDGLGRTVVSTWTRESRKTPGMPGIRRFTVPNLWALIDTSGSIGEEELSLFLGTVWEFNALCDVRVICWDAEAYEPITLRQKSAVLEKVRGKIRGGGGTCIIPALRKTLEEMRGLNIVIVLTDGHIYDWEEANNYLSQVAKRSLSSIVLWTDREVRHPLWKSLRLSHVLEE